jgi:bifunctional enzyme CysN/CysC
MATGASTATLAVILVDARKGVLAQTCRHSRIVSLMGITEVVLAVNKMDLVEFDRAVFEGIESAYRRFSEGLGFRKITAIPLCALDGDNVVERGARLPWYFGPSLLECLHDAGPSTTDAIGPFRMPVQLVNRAGPDFRGFCGRIAAGRVRPGDRIRILPSGAETSVRQILTWGGELASASAGDSVTVAFADEVDASRGDLLAAAESPTEVADQFQAHVLWIGEHPLIPGRVYLMKIHTREASATITAIKHRLDVASGAHLAARTIATNEIALVTLSTSRPIPFEPYRVNRSLGGFILVDRHSYETVGAGMIEFALRRASNVHWQALDIDKTARASMKQQRPRCVWFTGLSGAGKSTVANLLERRLHAEGRHTYLLDGDNVRHRLNRDLGFTEADRVENIRRVAEVAHLLVDAGLIVLVSLISPYRSDREVARNMFASGEFVEVFVDAPLEVCELRDTKGLYAKARRGELKNFTGIDGPYEQPESPEVWIRTATMSPEECVDRIVEALGDR